MAGVAPALLFAAWTWIVAWYQSIGALVLIVSLLAVIAILAGGVVGARIGPSLTSSILGVVAYAASAWLLFVPVGVARTILEGLSADRIRDGGSLLVTAVGGLAYGLVSTLYMVVLLLPLGAAWVVTFRALGHWSRP